MTSIYERWVERIASYEAGPESDETLRVSTFMDVPCPVLQGIRAAFCIAKKGNRQGMKPGFYLSTNLIEEALDDPGIKDAIDIFVINALKGESKNLDKPTWNFDSAVRFTTAYMSRKGVILRIEPASEEEFKKKIQEVENGNVSMRYSGEPIPFRPET